MRITVLYDAIEDTYKRRAEEQGKTLALIYEQVAEALGGKGHTVQLLPAGERVQELAQQLDRDESDLIFNLCESLGGVNQHEQNVASLLELFDKPFTGSGPMGLALAQDKVLSKKIFSFHDVKYPKFSIMDFGQVEWSDQLKFPLFVKPVGEDASIGINSDSIVKNVKELMERISFMHTELKSAALIEEFIDGREIYVGVLGNDRPEALPLLEWDFSQLADKRDRIASAEAKWDRNSAAYQAPEIFPADIPEAVQKKMQDAAVVAFRALRLRDYGRVDFRLRRKARKGNGSGKEDEKRSHPEEWEFFIIEVNPNPFLEMKAELATAAAQKGISHGDLIHRIAEMAFGRHRKS